MKATDYDRRRREASGFTGRRWWCATPELSAPRGPDELAEATGVLDTGLIADRFMLSATFAVMAFLAVYFVYAVFWGSRWERMLFAPIVFAGALLAGWLTFT